MAAEIKLTRTKAEDGGSVKLDIAFAFGAQEPAAGKIYHGITLLICALFPDDVAREFLLKLNELRRDPRGGVVSGEVKA